MLKEKSKIKKTIISVIIGVFSGLVNGIFGGGGGMIVVPMLENLLQFKTKNAHATAIMIILPLSILSSTIYIANGNFDLSIGIPTLIGVFAGGYLGAYSLKKISSKWLFYLFNIIMIVAGIKMFCR